MQNVVSATLEAEGTEGVEENLSTVATTEDDGLLLAYKTLMTATCPPKLWTVHLELVIILIILRNGCPPMPSQWHPLVKNTTLRSDPQRGKYCTRGITLISFKVSLFHDLWKGH
jgi:hypothetical protein